MARGEEPDASWRAPERPPCEGGIQAGGRCGARIRRWCVRVSGEGSSAHDLPVRALRGQHYWHQVPVRHEVVYVPVSPSYGARFHVAGGDGVWYASSTREGAWSEFFRHFLDDGVNP